MAIYLDAEYLTALSSGSRFLNNIFAKHTNWAFTNLENLFFAEPLGVLNLSSRPMAESDDFPNFCTANGTVRPER
jgi:hypothetical protein